MKTFKGLVVIFLAFLIFLACSAPLVSASTPPQPLSTDPGSYSPPSVLTPNTDYLLYANWQLFSPQKTLVQATVNITGGASPQLIILSKSKTTPDLWATWAYWHVPSEPGVLYEFTWSATDDAQQTNTKVTRGQTTTATVYTLTLSIKDQAGNPLPTATVFINMTSYIPNSNGIVTYSNTKSTLSLRAWYQGYETTKTIVLDSSKSVPLVINRLFLIKFMVKDTEGNPLTGSIIAVGATKNTTIPITNGEGATDLSNGFFTLYFVASAPVNLGTIQITNDATLTFTVNTVTGTLEGKEETLQDPLTVPYQTPPGELPFYLIPGPYIYILLAVLIIISVVAIVVRAKTRKRS